MALFLSAVQDRVSSKEDKGNGSRVERLFFRDSFLSVLYSGSWTKEPIHELIDEWMQSSTMLAHQEHIGEPSLNGIREKQQSEFVIWIKWV